MEEKTEELAGIIRSHPAIKVAYLFGSQATGETGPLSDYDIAIYFDERDPKKMFDLKFQLQDEIGRLLGTNKVDVVVLNLAQSPELKYQIIKEGKIIYEEEPYRLLVEPKILNEYFDLSMMLKKYNLTKA